MKPSATFDPRRAAKKLLREARSGALATLARGSAGPYCSLVNVASDADGAPLLLLSQLAVHTKNIAADSRVSLMLDERKPGDPLQGARVTLVGAVEATQDPAARARYLTRQPEAAAFADFKDFSLYRMRIDGGHLVAGFGRIVDLAPEDMLTPVEDAAALRASEREVVEHMNEAHAETVQLYARRLLGAPEGPWRCVGCDPEGLELQCGRTALRLPFPRRVTSPQALRVMLRELAETARGSAADRGP